MESNGALLQVIHRRSDPLNLPANRMRTQTTGVANDLIMGMSAIGPPATVGYRATGSAKA